MTVARATLATTAALRANERLLGATCLVIGAVLFYVAMLDQGQLLGVLLGAGAANANYFAWWDVMMLDLYRVATH